MKMDSPQEKMNKKLEELKRIFGEPKPVQFLSELTMRTFCIGFYLPLYGSLSYLIDNTTAYKNISCTAKVEYNGEYTITGQKDYDVFAKNIEHINAPTSIEFIYYLSDSSYSLGVSINDIEVAFTVYFQKDHYELVYSRSGAEKLRYSKKYNEDIEPVEIYKLRDEIKDYVFHKVAENIEEILSRM